MSQQPEICENRNDRQSKESIFIDRQQKLNHILLYIHIWMDEHSHKKCETL